MELICCYQNYDWGKKGKSSLVAKFAHLNTNISISEDTPYAEFWMGTHPNGPAILKANNILLSHHIEEHGSELGHYVTKTFGRKLPFLFKILSINKALSIQTHPSKHEAELLHKSLPDIYKDCNHKPEMAIALTEFKCLCSFRPISEIKFYLLHVPEFQLLINHKEFCNFLECSEIDTEKSKTAMKNCFQSLMNCPVPDVKSAVDKLANRLENSSEAVKSDYYYHLVQKLNNEFPGDVGIFCIYWLNYLELKPGQAIFLPPNEPHAYLSGDCIECMANSDNVVRAGLTTKLRDVPTLCHMLSYKCCTQSDVIFKPIVENQYCTLFSPSVQDFSIVRIDVPKNEKYILPIRESVSILVVTEGDGITTSGTHIQPGSVFYLPSGKAFCVTTDKGVIIYQAMCNIYFS